MIKLAISMKRSSQKKGAILQSSRRLVRYDVVVDVRGEAGANIKTWIIASNRTWGGDREKKCGVCWLLKSPLTNSGIPSSTGLIQSIEWVVSWIWMLESHCELRSRAEADSVQKYKSLGNTMQMHREKYSRENHSRWQWSRTKLLIIDGKSHFQIVELLSKGLFDDTLLVKDRNKKKTKKLLLHILSKLLNLTVDVGPQTDPLYLHHSLASPLAMYIRAWLRPAERMYRCCIHSHSQTVGRSMADQNLHCMVDCSVMDTRPCGWRRMVRATRWQNSKGRAFAGGKRKPMWRKTQRALT